MTGTSENRKPVRTCVGCRTRRPKSELLRLALDPRERVIWDSEQTMPGRGAYLCPASGCLADALKKRRLNRAFRRHVDTCLLEKEGIPLDKEHLRPKTGRIKTSPIAGIMNG